METLSLRNLRNIARLCYTIRGCENLRKDELIILLNYKARKCLKLNFYKIIDFWNASSIKVILKGINSTIYEFYSE